MGPAIKLNTVIEPCLTKMALFMQVFISGTPDLFEGVFQAAEPGGALDLMPE